MYVGQRSVKAYYNFEILNLIKRYICIMYSNKKNHPFKTNKKGGLKAAGTPRCDKCKVNLAK